mmetsp:Transcript_22555/g.38697  ORF Transcript_22555/g.38697 Transcript_22555/m.38697 type:complete len:151 (+) Transcript_22555:27-479(+)
MREQGEMWSKENQMGEPEAIWLLKDRLNAMEHGVSDLLMNIFVPVVLGKVNKKIHAQEHCLQHVRKLEQATGELQSMSNLSTAHASEFDRLLRQKVSVEFNSIAALLKRNKEKLVNSNHDENLNKRTAARCPRLWRCRMNDLPCIVWAAC